MARRFHQRTINETYREQRVLGDDDVTARARVNERLLPIYGEVPTEAEMDAAAAHFDATHVPEDATSKAADDIPTLPGKPGSRQALSSMPAKPTLTAAHFADRDDITTALDVPCPFCGVEHQSCVENGAPFPTHRARVILVQGILDARERRKSQGDVK